MKKHLFLIFISLFLFNVLSCATMTIEGDGQKSPQSKTGTHTKHGSFYGFTWKEPAVTKCDNRRGIYRARYHTNALYVLAMVASLGLYVPQTVEWWCDAAPANDDDEEPYRPSN